ncbi:TetR/AcrR family transcriptional regulator [Actinospica durhamensis]|uniref:TetR/AcrR family transcriptional regulator n=1 Tax=Actinospica durhamensis TaxID=1508375 RepID=A0A941IVZ0_9ACTN|nr:TetR/AcrR family transcriptional regulator [Actinospica durhamensis]MBR7838046.1 TetR/AcrR family transcriptional regulator [Actinospica durhamensis]
MSNEMTNERPELIWLRPERATRGPAPAHSRAAIAATAIALADAEGLAGVSMRKIAAALGAGTMSLYTYVPKKEHLFDLMLDAVAGEWRLPDQPSGDQRADLADFARQGIAAMRRHPWTPALVLTRPSMGPNSLRCTEYFLAVMAASPLSGGTKMELFAMLNGSICQFAQWEANQREAGGSAQWQAELATYLGSAVATGAYPHLAAAFAGGETTDMDPDAVFDRFVARVIDLILAAKG